MKRSLGFAFRVCAGWYQGSFAKAQQPFALIRSPFGAGGWRSLLQTIIFADSFFANAMKD